MNVAVENLIYWLPLLLIFPGFFTARKFFTGAAAFSAALMFFFAAETFYISPLGNIKPLAVGGFQAFAFYAMSDEIKKKIFLIVLAAIYIMTAFVNTGFAVAFGAVVLLLISDKPRAVAALSAAAAAASSFLNPYAAGIFLLLLYYYVGTDCENPVKAAAGAFVVACALPRDFFGPAAYAASFVLLAMTVHKTMVSEETGGFVAGKIMSVFFILSLFMNTTKYGYIISIIVLSLAGSSAYIAGSEKNTVNKVRAGEAGIKPFLACVLLLACDFSVIAGAYSLAVRSQSDSLLMLAMFLVFAPVFINTAVIVLTSYRAVGKAYAEEKNVVQTSFVAALTVIFTFVMAVRL